MTGRGQDRGKPWRARVARWLKRGAAVCGLLMVVVVALGVGMYLQYEEPAFDTAAASGITFTPLARIVPGPGLPEGLMLFDSNNNVDLAAHDGRTYMAFRTAPTHFAGVHSRIVILSSADREKWDLEHEIAPGRDVREPRLFVFRGRLYFYYFEAGTDWLRFEPRRILALEKRADGWSEPVTVMEGPHVVWRVREHGDRAYMSVYNAESMYTPGGETPGDVQLLVSDDGYVWEPAFDTPQVRDVGAEEGDFAFDEEGNLVAVVRQEVRGGSMVCTASRDNLGKWDCRFSPYKVDSALLFRHGENFYVIGRRNVAGPCDRELDLLPGSLSTAWNFAVYSMTRKRTALYRVDTERKLMVPLFDFPSCGDTAFAGMVPVDGHGYYVVNYSSPLDGPDWPWLAGQLIGSCLYETVLRFPVPRVSSGE